MQIAQSTTIQAYQLHKGGTRARMAILRMIAAASVDNVNEATRLQPGDWRGARHYTLGTYEAAYSTLGRGANGKTPVWVTHTGEYFRNEMDASDVLRGMGQWCTDTEGQEGAIGIIAYLPHGRFLAGYRWTANDERVYFGEVFTDQDDACRMADEHARVFADGQQEHESRYLAMSLAELDVEQKEMEVEKAFALRSRAKFGGRPRVHEAIEALRTAREELEEATRAYEA